MYARPILVRKILTTLILCAPALTAGAQSGFVERMDSILAARRERLAAKYDTAYIGLPDKKWTVKLRTTAQGTDLNTKGTLEGMAFSSMLKTDISATVGANISYRGLTLGFSINPAKLYGKNKDNTFTLSSYGNRMGIDLSYSSANTFSGKAEYGGEKRRIAAGKVGMDLLETNVYYSFNRRKFSFPAVFTQSQVQKHSCGTWLAALSAFAGKFTTGDGTIPGLANSELSMLNVAVGAGYAYNFALRRKWLLHISATPQLVVYSRARLLVGGDRQRAPFKFPALTNVGRIAATYNFRNSFMGMYVVVNTWNMGDRDKMSTGIIRWRARMLYGIRF